jgi:hypothetical protein
MNSIMQTLLLFMAIATSLVLIYFAIAHPWTLNWGATKDEVARALPGDEIVETTHFVATRAFAIQAAPACARNTNFPFPGLYYILYDFGDILMMSECMLGIKTRSEKRK